jgi:hypothetical protein
MKHKAKNLGVFLCEMSSPQEGTHLLGIPSSYYLYAKGKALLHPGPQAPPSVHMVLLLVMPGCEEGLPICIILSQTLGI